MKEQESSAFINHVLREADQRQRLIVEADGLEVRMTIWERSTASWSGGGQRCMEAGGTKRGPAIHHEGMTGGARF